MLDKNTLVSFFRSVTTNEEHKRITLEQAITLIQKGGFKKHIEEVRQFDSEGNKKAKDNVKKQLPTISFQGVFDTFRKANNFEEATGIVTVDIDDIEDDIDDIKEDIMEDNDHVFSVMVSPSGTGVKVLHYIEKELITAENYKQINKYLKEEYSVYGKIDNLTITDSLIMTYDPDIIVNWECVPDMPFIPESEEDEEWEDEEHDEEMDLYEEPMEFFEDVLYNKIADDTSNNFEFIQRSIFALASYGFRHPQHDLTFIADFSSDIFKPSDENVGRVISASEKAADIKQTKYPYYFKGQNDSKEEKEEGSFFYETAKNFDKIVAKAKEGERVGLEISLQNFADIFRFTTRGIITVTGIPQSGKTEFVDQILLDLSRLHGKAHIVAGFEQTVEEHIIKLSSKLVHDNVRKDYWIEGRNLEKFEGVVKLLSNYFYHIDTDSNNELGQILKRSEDKINELREKGVDVFSVLIDPFNMLAFKGKDVSDEGTISEMLKKISMFSIKNNVCAIVVAHPRKMEKEEKTNEYKVPDLYNVKGSSSWFDMSYHGLVVHRKEGKVLVKVLKVKQKNQGERLGECFFEYKYESGRYMPINEGGIQMEGDHNSNDWLKNFAELHQNR